MSSSGKMEGPSAPVMRRDPYEVLSVPRDSSDQEIKSAYRKLALKSVLPYLLSFFVMLMLRNGNVEMIIIVPINFDRYHPDKNASNPEASELFKEVAYSYSILSDPEKRRQYDTAGFEALENEGMDMEIDLSNLGTVNTMFAALFSKLGVPIKTTISPTVLEEAMNGTVTVRPLPVGTSATGKVDKQCAHFFGVTISDEQAHSGIVVRVTSAAQSKFKLLYFEQEVNGGYGLALQEDSQKTGKVTSAGMYFLHFQVYRMDSSVNALAMAKDPEAAFFKRLEGDNFFKPASYIIEAMCAKSYEDTTERLKEIESKILAKRNDLRQFETEYRKALARFQEVTTRYTQEREASGEDDDDVKLGHYRMDGAGWQGDGCCPLLSKGLTVQWQRPPAGVLLPRVRPLGTVPTTKRCQYKATSPQRHSGVPRLVMRCPAGSYYNQVDDMLRERDNIHCSFTTERTMVNPVGAGSSSSRYTAEQSIPESPENGNVDGRDKSGKKKWFNLNLNRSDKKA
ncbi:hypothetical protein EJB05_15623, partial [Eragrostis curvula]